MRRHAAPLRLVLRGVLAGAAGTAAMDAVMYAEYRTGGGILGAWQWETSAGLDSWDTAPAPALVGKRLYEVARRRDLSPAAARLTNNVMHWAYGSGNGALLGLMGEPRRRPVRRGALFGVTVFTSSYAVLGVMGLYKLPWQYPAGALAKDLGHHLVYGTVAALGFAAAGSS